MPVTARPCYKPAMILSRTLPAATLALALLLPAAARPEAPEILAVEAFRTGMGWRIDVTLEHPDAGWDHFADAWEVLDDAGNRLGFRELMHPHVEEQPFTRSLYNVMLPDGLRRIHVRARCSQDGWSDETFAIDLEP